MNAPPQPRDIFRGTLWRLCRHFAIAIPVVIIVVATIDPPPLAGTSAWIWAGAMGLAMAAVFAVSLLPGMILQRVDANVSATDRVGLFLIGGVNAMIIRGSATIALMVTCRYKFAAGSEEVGEVPLASLMIGLWYVAATIDEVRLLAIGGLSLDHRDPRNSRGSGIEDSGVMDRSNVEL